LESDERPYEIVCQWEKGDGKKKEECQFVFKKKIFLKDDEHEMEDAVARDLIYRQALSSVICSDYIFKEEEAIKLAGLQFQVVYGDHNAQNHQPGFLINNVKDFVPKHLFALRRPAEWEQAILRQHESLVGKSVDNGKSEYIAIVKKFPFYGTTFFPPCRPAKGVTLPSKVIIGVNFEGIRLFKHKNKELISEHLFTEVCSWSSSSSGFSFEFGNQNESLKYTFDTKHGSIIASTIQMYIDILVQILKEGGEDESDSATASQLTDN